MEYRHSNMIITGMIASSSRFVLDMIDLSKITYHVMVAVGRLLKSVNISVSLYRGKIWY